MRITFRNHFVALATVILITASASALLSAPAAARDTTRRVTTARVTTARVTTARVTTGHRDPWLAGETSGKGLRLTRHDAVADAIGKVFLTLGHTDYVCSGALVSGGHFTVVATAAHCATDGVHQATSWTFVPGYRDGQAPYGQYTARQFYVSPRWTGPGHGAERYDVAFVRVSAATLYGDRRVAAPPRGLPVRFARSQASATLASTYVFGYPALAPFSGQYPNYCAGPAAVAGSGRARAHQGSAHQGSAHQGSARTECTMTAGDSGGPWLAGFRPQAGAGTIVAVTTFKLSGAPQTLYGTVLGPSARALYQAATGQSRVTRGR